MPKRAELIGRRFYNLTVIEEGPVNLGTDNRRGLWKCICDCGKERLIDTKSLKAGISKTCGFQCPFFKERCRYGKKKDELREVPCKFNLTMAQVLKIVDSPCHYCGIVPSKGMDRRVNMRSYEPTNTLPCCPECHYLKGKLGEVNFIRKCLSIIEHQFGVTKEEIKDLAVRRG